MEEIWLAIKGYEEFYEVSNFGNIKSLRFNRLMKPTKNKTHGYLSVPLNNGNKVVRTYIHRLVAQHFIGYSNLTVNHKDGNKSNNKISNLEWMTHSDNHKHAFKLGLKKSRDVKGQDNFNTNIDDIAVKKIKKYLKNTNMTQQEIATSCGTSRSVVNKIKNNKTWKHISEE